MLSAIKNLSPDTRGGIALLAATIGAILFASLGGAEIYHDVLHHKLRLGTDTFYLEKTVHHWINDGLMVLFFLLVGIEINHEFREGQLKGIKKALPPFVCALGGFIAPALVYLLATANYPEKFSGWSIPTATDIAFVVAIVSALRSSVPMALRAFLIALAVIDDLMAITVIALFYTAEVVWMNIWLAAGAALVIYIKNRLGLRFMWLYAVIGFVIWLGVLKSGVHATLAGVIFGFLLPIHEVRGKPAPAKVIESAIKPWVRWLVVPVFAFANAGIDLSQLSFADIFSPITIGIMMALFLGKQIGIFGAMWGLEKAGIALRPGNSNWLQVYAVSLLCGIGFTMSLFIGSLALGVEFQTYVRLGVLCGSLLSGTLGVIILLQQDKILAFLQKFKLTRSLN